MGFCKLKVQLAICKIRSISPSSLCLSVFIRGYFKNTSGIWGKTNFDKNKQAANSPECPVGANCQGRGGVPPPAAICPLKTTNFAFSDRVLASFHQES